MQSSVKFPGKCVCIVALLTVFAMVWRVEGAEDCKSVMMTMVKGQLANVKLCLSEMEFRDGKEKSEKMMCVILCAMQKTGFFDKDGKPDAAGSLTYLEATVPPEIRDKFMESFLECQHHIGTLKPQSEDPNCKSYESLMKCAQGTANKICL